MHITEMFYILYMMSSQKAIIFVSKIVINSCSGVLASFKPCVSHYHRQGKMLLLCDYYTTRKVSFHATFTTIPLLSLQQILFVLCLSLSNTGHYQHTFTANNAASLAEHIPSASFKAATPWGVRGLCSLRVQQGICS